MRTRTPLGGIFPHLVGLAVGRHDVAGFQVLLGLDCQALAFRSFELLKHATRTSSLHAQHASLASERSECVVIRIEGKA